MSDGRWTRSDSGGATPGWVLEAIALVMGAALLGAGPRSGSGPRLPSGRAGTGDDTLRRYTRVVDTITYPPLPNHPRQVWCDGSPLAKQFCIVPDDSTVVRWFPLVATKSDTITVTVSSAAFDVRIMLRRGPTAETLVAMNDDGPARATPASEPS